MPQQSYTNTITIAP